MVGEYLYILSPFLLCISYTLKVGKILSNAGNIEACTLPVNSVDDHGDGQEWNGNANSSVAPHEHVQVLALGPTQESNGASFPATSQVQRDRTTKNTNEEKESINSRTDKKTGFNVSPYLSWLRMSLLNRKGSIKKNGGRQKERMEKKWRSGIFNYETFFLFTLRKFCWYWQELRDPFQP